MRARHVASQTTGATRLNYTERVQRSLSFSLSFSLSLYHTVKLRYRCQNDRDNARIRARVPRNDRRTSLDEEISFSSEASTPSACPHAP